MVDRRRTATRKTRYWVGLVALFLTSTWVFLMVWAVLPAFFLGWEPVAITSDSMAPTIHRGDVVVAGDPGDTVLSPGTVVVFNDPAREGMVTHRILAVTPDGAYVTKGDSNERRDSTTVDPSLVVGAGRVLVPVVGLPLIWIREGQLLLFAAWGLIGLAAVWCSRWAFTNKPRRPDPPKSGSGKHPAAGPDVAAQPARPPVPVSSGRHRALFALGVLILVMGSAWVPVHSRAQFTASPDNSGNTLTTDALDPPTGLTATSGATITLDWTATPDTYASGHRVLRSATSGGPYSQIAEVTPRTTTTYVDSPADGTYYYVVRAFYLSWESANSNEDSATAGSTTSVTLTSVADTHAQQNKGDTNYGTDTSMMVRTFATAKNARAFVQFDVSSIPAGSTVSSATLTLCATSVPGSTRTYDLHRVTASWVETTLTWNNQPGVAATLTDSSTTPAAAGCMSWTVTTDVQTWVDGTANNGWRAGDSVEDASRNESKFRTRENGTASERPTLDVTYTTP